MHVRQQIREAAAALLAEPSNRWQRVFVQREAPLRSVKPYLMVYTPSEPAAPATVHQPFLLRRDLTLIVQAHIRIADPESMEIEFDRVAAEIEQKLIFSSVQLKAPKLTGLYLTNTQSDIVINENSERQYGELSMTWQAQYYTAEGNPS